MSAPILKQKVGETKYQDHPLEGLTCTVGRSRDCDITVEDSSLSRLHLRLEKRKGSWYVIDNNSSNGTFINRRKVKEAPLIHGDSLIAGRVQFTFHEEPEGPGTVTRPMPTFDNTSATIRGDLDTFHSGDDLTPPPMTVPPPASPPTPPPVAQAMGAPAPPAVPPPMPPTGSAPIPASKAEAGSAATMDLDGSRIGPADKADPKIRLLAAVIDAGIGIALAIPGMVMGWFGLGLVGLVLQLVGTIACLAHILVGWLKYGKTLGKHMMKLHIEAVEDPETVGLEPKVIVLRMLGMILSACTCGLLFLTVLFDPTGRGLHDKLAGTRVVHDKA